MARVIRLVYRSKLISGPCRVLCTAEHCWLWQSSPTSVPHSLPLFLSGVCRLNVPVDWAIRCPLACRRCTPPRGSIRWSLSGHTIFAISHLVIVHKLLAAFERRFPSIGSPSLPVSGDWHTERECCRGAFSEGQSLIEAQ